MHGLQTSLESFANHAQSFSSALTKGVEELTGQARAKPSVGAESFRESLEELQQQADNARASIGELDSSTQSTVALEGLLGHCVALLRENGERVKSLEHHLRKFGHVPEFAGSKDLGNAREGLQDSLPQNFQSLVQQGQKDRRLRRSLSSPGPLSDAKIGSIAESLSQWSLLTPSPVPSHVPSMSSVSPGLRELQLKYGQGPANSVSPGSRSRGQSFGSPQKVTSPKKQKTPQRADMGSWITRKLQDKSSVPSSPVSQNSALSADSRQSSRQRLNNENADSGNLVQNARLGADDVRPPSTKLLTVQTQARSLPTTGDSGSAMSLQGNNTPLGKDDIINVRLANGEAPWDMLSLKAAINQAVPGTGDVQKVIESATFHPQAAAFTSLLHMCAKNKLWQKALEVFDGMKKYHAGVTPNTVHFSSLISACGTAGRWKEAMQVFEEMKEHARKHPQCTPNVITFSALMTACCSGGRPDQAHTVFKDMIAQGIKPDHISYSTLIAGYERWGDMEKATQLFEEMRAAGLSQSLGPQSYLEQFSRKIQRNNSSVTESHEAGLRKLAASHKQWGLSNDMPDSPAIAAHFPAGLPLRNRSNDGTVHDDANAMAIHRELMRDRAGVSGNYGDFIAATPVAQTSQPVVLTPQRTPLSQMRQSISGPVSGLRSGGGSGRYRDIGRSPLSQSYDPGAPPGPLAGATSLQGPPPGFLSRNLVHTSSLDHAGSLTEKLQRQLGSSDFNRMDFAPEQVNQSIPQFPPGVDSVLDALVQQNMQVPQAMIPTSHVMRTPARPYMASSSPAPRAANGAPQIYQVSVEEYNNLPLRFSRQLSLDQMNEAVDYVNALVEGKHNSNARRSSTGGIELVGVTPPELIPLQYGIQRTTALLNCLLQLKRMRLCVRDEQQLYVLLA